MRYLLAFFLLVLLQACRTKSNYRKAADEIVVKAGGTEGMNTGGARYGLYVPDGWTTANRTNYGVDFYYLFAPKTAEDPNTNINVTTEFMRSMSLTTYREKTIEAIRQAIPSANILSWGVITANGLDGVWYSYSMEPQGIKATLVNYIFPKDGVAYIITAGTQTKDAARYRALFDSVARSFKFIE